MYYGLYTFYFKTIQLLLLQMQIKNLHYWRQYLCHLTIPKKVSLINLPIHSYSKSIAPDTKVLKC